MHLDAVCEPGPFVERIDGQLFNERYPIHQDVVALDPKLHVLHFLAPHDGPHIRLVHAHYPIRDAPARIIRFTFSIYDTTQLLQTNNPFLVIPITPVNKLKNLKTKPLYTPQTSIIKNAICPAQHPY